MATAKGRAIAEYAESKIGCAYIWGGYGEKLCTPSFRRERASAYPSQKNNIYRYCQVLSGQKTVCAGCRYNGKQAYDCAQLTRYACKAAGQELVSGSNAQWRKTDWDAHGTIDTLPDVEGVILYHMDGNGEMSHTGVYVGNGYAVEARAAAYGVVKTLVKNRSWTHWAALPSVLHSEDGQVSTPTAKPQETPSKGQIDTAGAEVVSMTTLRNGATGTKVRVLQWLLNEKGFNAGKVDGIFGKTTLSAVKAYQCNKGLDVDGVVGKKTWTSLLA